MALSQALRSFNWMTWIAPDNFALGAVTGFYGGMGYNPWATFDWVGVSEGDEETAQTATERRRDRVSRHAVLQCCPAILCAVRQRLDVSIV